MSDPRPSEVLLPSEAPGVAYHHRRVRSGRIELAVVEVGQASDPAMVIAHGVGSSARFVVEAFAGAVVGSGHRLVTYDLRGHGASSPAPDPSDHHLDDHVGDLAAVVASCSVPPVVIGGVSLGAHAAVRGAARGVATSAVLACFPAWVGGSVVGEGPHALVAEEVRRIGIEAVIARLRTDTTMPTWLRETLVADYGRHDPASLTAALLALDGGDAPSPAELRELGDRPLAVVGWPDDPGHPIEVAHRFARLAPTSAIGQLEIADLSSSRARLGEVAIATLARLAPAPR